LKSSLPSCLPPFKETAKSIERPGQVLLILAEDDRGFQSTEREALKASYPGAIVHTFPSGGHLSGFTHPKEFNQVLLTTLISLAAH
jgi:pimeloyl-ACP methyl ester carboxylesterase